MSSLSLALNTMCADNERLESRADELSSTVGDTLLQPAIARSPIFTAALELLYCKGH